MAGEKGKIKSLHGCVDFLHVCLKIIHTYICSLLQVYINFTHACSDVKNGEK